MTIFDLLFILLFLTFIMSLLLAAWNAVRGRRDTAIWIAARVAVLTTAYLAVVITVGLASPRRIIPAGQDLCADDWCIAVVKAVRWPAPDAAKLAVTVRVWSRARRVAQSATDARVYVLDSDGRTYEVSDTAQQAYDAAHGPSTPLSIRLLPGESILTTRVFEVPRNAHSPALVLVHGGFPGWFIIGDSNSLFHKRTIMPF